MEGDDGAGVLMEHVLGVLGGSGIEGVIRGEVSELQGGDIAKSELCVCVCVCVHVCVCVCVVRFTICSVTEDNV